MKRNEIERLEELLEVESKLRQSGLRLIAGIDEVGRGPLAGPVVSAAVIFLPEKLKDLGKFAGLNDSKKVTEKNRRILSEIIKEEAEAFALGIVDEKTIDLINIFKASALSMETAVKSLKISPEHLLIDGNFKIDSKIPQTTVIKGDAKCFSIAAASIVAKVARDKMMVELDKKYPQYGFAVHKGYGTAKHIEAIRKFGRCEVHRKCFGKDF